MPLRPTSSREKLKLSIEVTGPRNEKAFTQFVKELDAVIKKNRAKVTSRIKETRK
jgi:hypothetical protein